MRHARNVDSARCEKNLVLYAKMISKLIDRIRYETKIEELGTESRIAKMPVVKSTKNPES